jgi:hypothetical protein
LKRQGPTFIAWLLGQWFYPAPKKRCPTCGVMTDGHAAAQILDTKDNDTKDNGEKDNGEKSNSQLASLARLCQGCRKSHLRQRLASR